MFNYSIFIAQTDLVVHWGDLLGNLYKALTLRYKYKAETILPINKANIAENIPLNICPGISVIRDTKIHPSSKRVAVEMNFVFL